MKKLFIFLAVVAMIITPALSYGQLTQQNRDQLRIIESGINSKKNLIKQLQAKILYISSLKEEINNLQLVDSLGELNKKQKKRLDDCLVQFSKCLIEDPYLEERLEEETLKLEILKEKAEEIKMYAATNNKVPEEPGYYQGKRLKKGFELREYSLRVQELESKVSFNNKVRELTLKKLEGDTQEAPFTLLLVNYSKINNRHFLLKNSITGEETSYVLESNQTLELKVFPGDYYCDITDMSSGRKLKNNFAKVSIKTHVIDGKECNAFFYAPKYF